MNGARFSLRPVPARWFELLTARDDLTLTVDTLARTAAVELETHSESATPLLLPDLRGRLEEYNRLAHRYQGYWPHDELRPSTLPGSPLQTLEKALARLYRWRDEADPLVRRIETAQGELGELALLREMLLGLGDSPLDLALLAGGGPALAARLFVLPPRTRVSQLPAGILNDTLRGKEHEFLLAVGAPAEVAALEQELTLLKGRPMPLPPPVTIATLPSSLTGDSPIEVQEGTRLGAPPPAVRASRRRASRIPTRRRAGSRIPAARARDTS